MSSRPTLANDVIDLEADAVSRSITSLAKAAGVEPTPDIARSGPPNSGCFKKGEFDPRRHVHKKGEVSFAKRLVLNKLAERAAEIADRLTRTALDELKDGDLCIGCGRNTPVPIEQQIKAMLGILDRIGVGAHTTQKVSGKLDIPEGAVRITRIENVIIDPRGVSNEP